MGGTNIRTSSFGWVVLIINSAFRVSTECCGRRAIIGIDLRMIYRGSDIG